MKYLIRAAKPEVVEQPIREVEVWLETSGGMLDLVSKNGRATLALTDEVLISDTPEMRLRPVAKVLGIPYRRGE